MRLRHSPTSPFVRKVMVLAQTGLADAIEVLPPVDACHGTASWLTADRCRGVAQAARDSSGSSTSTHSPPSSSDERSVSRPP
jgi:hypothetical protein